MSGVIYSYRHKTSEDLCHPGLDLVRGGRGIGVFFTGVSRVSRLSRVRPGALIKNLNFDRASALLPFCDTSKVVVMCQIWHPLTDQASALGF